MPDTILTYNRDYGTPYHSVYVRQGKAGFEIRDSRIRFAKEANKIKVGCIEIVKSECNYEIFFRYDGNCGLSVRYDKKNKPLYEKAMSVSNAEFGRIIYNGRHTSFYDSWYELHIINVADCTDKNDNIFILNEPGKEYRQLAHLY